MSGSFDIRVKDAGHFERIENSSAILSIGVLAFGSLTVERLVRTISLFDDFCAVKEPNSPGQFDVFEFDGVNVQFRIDYESTAKLDASSSKVVTRIISISLADGT